MKKKLRLEKIIILLISIIIACSFFVIVIILKNNFSLDFIKEPLKQETILLHEQPQRQKWLDNKNINPDYQGQIVFNSGLIDISFVQATSCYDENGNLYHFYDRNGNLITDASNLTGNDVYIWTNWRDMTYDFNILGGSVFMDYRNRLNDQNIVIYGHHFSIEAGNDPERVKSFTPLEKLLIKDNFEENRYLKLILDNETRVYSLVSVYKYDASDIDCLKNCQFMRVNYNYNDFNDVEEPDYYETYIKEIKKRAFYDTGVDLNIDDKTLTLQTCVSNHDGVLYEICVFKLIDTQYFQ